MEEQNKINEVLLNKYNEYSKKYNDNEIEKNELSKKLDAIKNELSNLYDKKDVLDNPKKYRKNKNISYFNLIAQSILIILGASGALSMIYILDISLDWFIGFLIFCLTFSAGYGIYGLVKNAKVIRNNNKYIKNIVNNNDLMEVINLIKEKEKTEQEIQSKYYDLATDIEKTYTTLNKLGLMDNTSNDKLDNSTLKRTRDKGNCFLC